MPNVHLANKACLPASSVLAIPIWDRLGPLLPALREPPVPCSRARGRRFKEGRSVWKGRGGGGERERERLVVRPGTISKEKKERFTRLVYHIT